MRKAKTMWMVFSLCALVFANLSSTLGQQRIALASINRFGTASGNLQSYNQQISANGRYVVFQSGADNLVPFDNNGEIDVFRHDLLTGTTQLVSVTPSGASGNGRSSSPVISASGEYVAFESAADNLLSGPPSTPADTNGVFDVFRRVFPASGPVICTPLCTLLISVNPAGTDAGGGSRPTISADGQKIAFLSNSSGLVTGNIPSGYNVYTREYGGAGTVTRLITAPVTGPFFCLRDSSNAVISANGRYIAFESLANDLTTENDPCNGSDGDRDVFVYDSIANLVRLASKAFGNSAGNGVSDYPVIANDGTVAFQSLASDLVANDSNNQQDVFIFRSGNPALVSANTSGTGSGNGRSDFPSISEDGQYVAFHSGATDLVAISDTNGEFDAFVRDLTESTTALVSITASGTSSGNRQSSRPAISANGRFVAFESRSSDLVTGVPLLNFAFHIFVRDLMADRTRMLTINSNYSGGGNLDSFDPRISANGKSVAFQSNATDLVTVSDTNQAIDVFAWQKSRLATDHDGDGLTDIAVWRPSNGVWYIRRSSNNALLGIPFGLNGDIPVPADYDGDGQTDVAVFRPSQGTWYVLNSEDNSFQTFQFGIAGDKPVAGDYDNDGRADVAVFRPSTGTWHLRHSRGGSYLAQQWGVMEDKPVPVDFDGDGATDIAVWRPSTGVWHILNSRDSSVRSQAWGLTGDKPVAGDYDGDGRADLAVFRPSNGVWYVFRSSNSALLSRQWGTNGDAPQPGDFDGDNRSDFAVWRPSNGFWYVLRNSTSTFTSQQWGLSSDVAVSSAYIIE